MTWTEMTCASFWICCPPTDWRTSVHVEGRELGSPHGYLAGVTSESFENR